MLGRASRDFGYVVFSVRAAIARFPVAHHITGSAAWIAALVMMALADVLTRLAVIYLRGRRLAPGPAVLAAAVPAGARA